jgi:hypothetical protein
MPVILAPWETEIRRITVQLPANSSLCGKIPNIKRAGRKAQVAQHLCSKQEAKSSNPSTAKKKSLIKV